MEENYKLYKIKDDSLDEFDTGYVKGIKDGMEIRAVDIINILIDFLPISIKDAEEIKNFIVDTLNKYKRK